MIHIIYKKPDSDEYFVAILGFPGNTSSLVDLELGISSAPSSQPNAPAGQQSSSSSIVDDQLLSLGEFIG